MIHGFDLSSPLVCEGIVGDGCGGGRFFTLENEALEVYDPVSKESTTLLKGIKNAISISKKACIITVECKKNSLKFDLSLMKIS